MKIAVFIDASNLWQAQKVKGKMFDFKKLVAYLRLKFSSDDVTCFYYTAYPANGTRSYNLDAKHKFFTYLQKELAFIVRKKELKRISTDSGFIEKGNMDVEMTIDAVDLKARFDTAILFTGDSDFLALITHLREHDKKVFVFSSENNVSNELRTGADGYTDVLRITTDIWRSELRFRDQK